MRKMISIAEGLRVVLYPLRPDTHNSSSQHRHEMDAVSSNVPNVPL